MDFNDTPEEAKFRAEAREWLSANAKPKDPSKVRASVSKKSEAERLVRAKEWQAKKAEAGYAAITWPTEYGGLGGTPIQSVIYSQEESKFDVPGGFAITRRPRARSFVRSFVPPLTPPLHRPARSLPCSATA